MIDKMTMKGFTLIEILVSLFILSLIGVMITTGLDIVVKTQLKVEKKYKLLTDIQIALTLMERDIQQVIDRPILNEKSRILAALQITENRIELTRSGFINPFSINKRGTLQRVAYHLDGSNLIRSTWNALDRDATTLSEDKIILSRVLDFNVHLISSIGASQDAFTTKALIIEITQNELGRLKRVFAIASNNFEVSHAQTT